MANLSLIIATVILVVVVAAEKDIEERIIENINKVQNTWIAEKNEVSEKGFEFVKSMCGAKISEDADAEPRRYDIPLETNIPDFFDSRTQWPHCPSISAVRNQGGCGSCWAVAASSCASDRLCIASRSRVRLNISAENLLSCCSFCPGAGHQGCDGGNPLLAWRYFQSYGIVTGGDYNSGEGCQPYEIVPSAEEDTKSEENEYTPPCYNACTNKRYGLSYNRDKHFGKSAYLIPKNIASIQSDVMRHGPVEATFTVYRDFYYYRTGVYTQTSSVSMGGHAVRLIGWGVENGVRYWLCANSWGKGWGENGLFKIRMGTNECGIESYITAGEVQK